MQHKLCISLTFLLMVGGAIDLSQATTIQEARLQYHTGKLSLASETLELAILTDPVYTTIHTNLPAIYQDISKNHYRQALNLESDYNQTPVASIDLNTDTDQIQDEEIQLGPKFLRAAINANLVNNTVTIRKRGVSTKPLTLNPKKLLVAPAKVGSQPDPANEVKTKLLEWAASRRRNFKNATYIKVLLSQIRIKADGRQYRAEFTQRYESDAYEDTVNKEMVFVRENGQWKIDAESSI